MLLSLIWHAPLEPQRNNARVYLIHQAYISIEPRLVICTNTSCEANLGLFMIRKMAVLYVNIRINPRLCPF